MATGIADVRPLDDDEPEDHPARETREPSPDLELEFEAIFRREYPAAIRFAQRYVDEMTAEDAVQAVFMRFWEGYTRTPALVFTGDAGRTRSAILAAVRNEVTDVRRRLETLVRTAPLISGLLGAPIRRAMAPDRRQGDEELSEVIARALHRLPRRQREVFYLVRFDEKSYKEAAEILGVSPGTVHHHLCKANEKLQQLLAEYHIPEPMWSDELYDEHVRRSKINDDDDEQA